MRNKVTYKTLFKEKNYLKVVSGNAITRFGDGIDTIAFSWLAYQLTGSTLLVATLFSINGLPNLIFGICSGVLCSYLPEKKIMWICDFGRGICVGLIAILYMTGNLQIWHLYVITFINSSFESFRAPASSIVFKQIIKREEMDNAIALTSSLCKITELLGYSTAPLFMAILGIGGAIVIDSATFLICGGLVLTIQISDDFKRVGSLSIKNCLSDFKDGVKYICKNKVVLNICAFAAITNTILVPYITLQAPYVVQVIDKGDVAMSIISVSYVLGMSISSLIIPKLKSIIKGKNLFMLGGFISAISYILLGNLGLISNSIVLYSLLVISIVIIGAGTAFLSFPLRSVLYKGIEKEYLSRVSSVFNALALCSVPITSFIIGLVLELITIKQLYIGFGVLIVIFFIIENGNKNIKQFENY